MHSSRDPVFEGLDQDALASILRQFYAEVRKVDGTTYSRSALTNIRASLQRHLSAPPHNRTFNILRDAAFGPANQVIQGQIKQLRVSGRDISHHKEAIAGEDLVKLYGSFDCDTATGLQNKVFLDILLHFARRGREGLRELRKDSFIIATDSTGSKYAKTAYHELEKNHNGQNPKVRDHDKVMYEQKDKATCPIKSLEKYLSKLNPQCTSFFQRPKSKMFHTDAVWYDNVPVGKNTLATKMRTLSQSVGCSQIYTNHCVRATAITTLSRAGIKDRDICSVSGHRRVESLDAYRAKPTTEKRQEMSTMLHKYSSGTPASDLSTSERPLSDVQMPPADVEVRPETYEASSTQVKESVSVSVPSSMRQDNQASFLCGNSFYGTVNVYFKWISFCCSCEFCICICEFCICIWTKSKAVQWPPCTTDVFIWGCSVVTCVIPNCVKMVLCLIVMKCMLCN